MRDIDFSRVEERGPEVDFRTGYGRVLVVDDEVFIGTLVSEIIAHELHAETVQVCSAEEAIAELQRGHFSLVISDIRMPGLGGFGLIEWIEANRPALKQRFLFITGYAGGSEADRMLAKLGVPVVKKPFTCAALINQCRELLAGEASFEVEVQGRCCLAA